jgi:hypothetical protein
MKPDLEIVYSRIEQFARSLGITGKLTAKRVARLAHACIDYKTHRFKKLTWSASVEFSAISQLETFLSEYERFLALPDEIAALPDKITEYEEEFFDEIASCKQFDAEDRQRSRRKRIATARKKAA